MIAEHMLAFLGTPHGQMLVRMMMAEGAEPELRTIIDSLRGDQDAALARIVEQARARGEIRADVAISVLLATMSGGLHHLMFLQGWPPDRADLEGVVDLVLFGATPR